MIFRVMWILLLFLSWPACVSFDWIVHIAVCTNDSIFFPLWPFPRYYSSGSCWSSGRFQVVRLQHGCSRKGCPKSQCLLHWSSSERDWIRRRRTLSLVYKWYFCWRTALGCPCVFWAAPNQSGICVCASRFAQSWSGVPYVSVLFVTIVDKCL